MSNVQQNIGENIRSLRLQKGQEQLAFISKVNTSYLGQIERGEVNATIKTLSKIAAALDTSILIANPKYKEHAKSKNAVLTVLTSEDIRQLVIETIKNNSTNDDE